MINQPSKPCVAQYVCTSLYEDNCGWCIRHPLFFWFGSVWFGSFVRFFSPLVPNDGSFLHVLDSIGKMS